VNSLFAGYTGNYGSHQLQTNLRRDNTVSMALPTPACWVMATHLRGMARDSQLQHGFQGATFNELYYPGYGNAA